MADTIYVDRDAGDCRDDRNDDNFGEEIARRGLGGGRWMRLC